MWVETASETFVARHDERDADDAERVLAQLEHARARLEERLGAEIGELAVVLHARPRSSTPRSRGCRCSGG